MSHGYERSALIVLLIIKLISGINPLIYFFLNPTLRSNILIKLKMQKKANSVTEIKKKTRSINNQAHINELKKIQKN